MDFIIIIFIIFIILILLIVLNLYNTSGCRPRPAYNTSGCRPRPAFNTSGCRPRPAFNTSGCRPRPACKKGGENIYEKNERFPNSNYNQVNYERHPNKDLVIDTLNLSGFLFNKTPTEVEIVKTIKYATPILKQYFPGRIMYVLKNKKQTHSTLIYKQLASELKIYIYIVENYEQDSPTWKLEKKYDTQIHSLHARDDLFAILLAKQYKCPILTNDKFSDISEFRDTVAPFKVLIYDYFTADYRQPTKESVKPANLLGFKSLALKKLYNYFKEGELL